MGAINKDGVDFLSDLGRRITQSTDDHRESVFLFQRLSVLIQRYSAVAVLVPSPTQPPRTKCSRSSIVLVFNLVFSPQDLYYQGQKIIIRGATVCIPVPEAVSYCVAIPCRHFA